ncbi:MAG: glycosyltransferase [Opitutales bacterium]|nr:glycosyltransferase [Opitutales bacterium]
MLLFWSEYFTFPLTDSFKTIAIKPFRNNVSDFDKNDAGRELVCLIFSKDRALQLDACLRSLQRSIRPTTLNEIPVHVVYKCSSKLHSLTYKNLREHWTDINWHLQRNFLNDVKSICHRGEHILFLVDDTLFVNEWNVKKVQDSLLQNPDSIGFSLRLGENTSYCYALNADQRIPVFSTDEKTEINSFIWTHEEYDFAYPLEVSSSIYRSGFILNLLKGASGIRNPNQLEHFLHSKREAAGVNFPKLGCFKKSVAFSNPLNLVQQQSQNRSGSEVNYSALELANDFLAGKRIDTDKFWGLKTRGAHQNEAIQWVDSAEPTKRQEPDSLKPTVSVIIPCYNYGEYLMEAVESVRNQTLEGVEIIVVDGGSNDESTPRILDRLQKEDCRVIRREGRHMVGSNRNLGIEHAKADLVCCLDADDSLDPTYLKKAAFCLIRNDFDVVGASMEAFGNDHSLKGLPSVVDANSLLEANSMSTASLFRKSLWKLAGGYEDFGLGEHHVHEDWHFWCKCARVGARFANISDEYLVRYRIHSSDSLSSQKGVVPDVDHQKKLIGESLESFKAKENLLRSNLDLPSFKQLVKDWRQNYRYEGASESVCVLVSSSSPEILDAIEGFIEPYRENGNIYLWCLDKEDSEINWTPSDSWLKETKIIRPHKFLRTDSERLEFFQFVANTIDYSEIIDFGSKWFLKHFQSLLSLLGPTRYTNLESTLENVLNLSRGREYLVADPLHGTGETVLEHIRITVTGLKEEASGGSEVWLLDILDKEMGTLLVPELKTLLPEGWEPRKSEGSPRGFALLAAAECQLEINLPQHTSLVFLTHAYSGIVVVENLSKQTKQEVSLYGSSSGQITIGTGSLSDNDLLSSIAASQSSAAVEDEIVELTISAHPAEKDPKRNSIKFFGITDTDHNSYPDGFVQFLEVEWTPSLHQNRLGLSLTGKDGQKLRVRMPKSALLHFERSPHAGELGFTWEGRTRFIDMSYPEYKKVTECLSYRFE